MPLVVVVIDMIPTIFGPYDISFLETQMYCQKEDIRDLGKWCLVWLFSSIPCPSLIDAAMHITTNLVHPLNVFSFG